jgi:(R)-2-hydroxyacyl-CoA dehydratese activating ATPase
MRQPVPSAPLPQAKGEAEQDPGAPGATSSRFAEEPVHGGRLVPRALGLDVGSTTVKLVAVDADGRVVCRLVEAAEPRVEDQVERLLAAAREACGLASLPLVATGYGRGLVRRADRRVTEITCHARGIYRELRRAGTLVDIGGQDSKVIRVGDGGTVVDFSMNDKCAAGTGRFLENSARRLGVSVERLGDVALSSSEEAQISSTCTVFAESEVVSLLAHGVAVETILKGLHRSLVKRVVSMIGVVGLAPPLMLSGGVAMNAAIARLIEEETGERAIVSSHPQIVGAYGAALIALDLCADNLA